MREVLLKAMRSGGWHSTGPMSSGTAERGDRRQFTTKVALIAMHTGRIEVVRILL